MEAVLILILTATTIAAAGSGKTAVNAAVETATAGATMTAAAVAIITAEIAAMNARTTMTAVAEMISVRSHALNPGPLTSIKAMCAAVKNIKTIVMTDNKKIKRRYALQIGLLKENVRVIPAHFSYFLKK